MSRQRPLLGLALLHGLAMAWLIGIELCLRVRDLEPASGVASWFRQPLGLPCSLWLLATSLVVVLGLGGRPRPIRLSFWSASLAASLLGFGAGDPQQLAMAAPAAALLARATTPASRDEARRRVECAVLVGAAVLVAFGASGPPVVRIGTPILLALVLFVLSALRPRPVAASLALTLATTPLVALLLLAPTHGADTLVHLGALGSLAAVLAATRSSAERVPVLVHAATFGLVVAASGLGEPRLALQAFALGSLVATCLAFGLLPCERMRRVPHGSLRRRRLPLALHSTTLAAALVALPLPGGWLVARLLQSALDAGAPLAAGCLAASFVLLAAALSRARRLTFFDRVHGAAPPVGLRPSPRDHRAASFDGAIVVGGSLALAFVLDLRRPDPGILVTAPALSLCAAIAWLSARRPTRFRPSVVRRVPAVLAIDRIRLFTTPFPHRPLPLGPPLGSVWLTFREFLLETAAPLSRTRVLRSPALLVAVLVALLLWIGRAQP